ncbi:MAG: hypothetical protein R3C27_08260 [Hyphomonadaceae bacterium]
MEALITLVPAALAFIAGVRMGPARSRIALRIAALVALALAVLARYMGTLPNYDWRTIALIAIGAGAALMCAIAFIGPSIFNRWLYALAVSVGVLTLIRLTVPRDTMIWLLTGMSPP